MATRPNGIFLNLFFIFNYLKNSVSAKKLVRSQFSNEGSNPALGAQSLNHGIVGEVLSLFFNQVLFLRRIFFLFNHYVLSDSATPWTVDCQAPLFVGFPGQEYWSGLLCSLLQGMFPTQGGKPASPSSRMNSLPLSYWGSPAHCPWLRLFPLNENLSPSVVFTTFCDSLSLPHPYMSLCQNLFMPPSCNAMVFAEQSGKILKESR